MARGGTRTAGLTRLRGLSRGTILLTLAIVALFAAMASNIPETVRESHQRRRDRHAFVDWANQNGGRRSYGVAVTETHARYDIVCSPHFGPVEVGLTFSGPRTARTTRAFPEWCESIST